MRGIGNRSRLDLVRKGRRMSVHMAVRTAPKAGKDDVRNLSGAHPFDGARVGNILPGTAEDLGLQDQEGVVILSVRDRSTAARLGFRAGDIVMQVGQERIETVSELERVLKTRPQLWQVLVKRGNQLLRLQLPG
jgi:S1-C subfamily serine protease